MVKYSEAQAMNRMSQVIKRAEMGEEVLITRHGVPVATITAIARDSQTAVGAAFEARKALDARGA